MYPISVPIYEIWHQATKSGSGATVMLVFLLLTGVFALNASQQTASRLTWSFARDNALVFSKFIRRIHPSLGVPVYALFFNAFVVFIIGCIYLGSTTAFNAIIGTGLILQQLSYGIPSALLLWRKRDARFLPTKDQTFNLGWLGWIVHPICVGWALLSLVFFEFPTSLPVSGSTMSKPIHSFHPRGEHKTLICHRLRLCRPGMHGSIRSDQLVRVC
jgi:choline transport protein